MRYPLLSEYMEAIRKAEDSFNQLSDLRPVLNGKGDPMMAIGDSSVVFKLQDVNTMRLYAVKCFTQEQPQRAENFQKIAERMERSSSPYLLRFRYLEREFFVDTTQSDEEYFPVLLMDWTEGITLDTYLKTHLHDCYALQLLTFRFCRMSAWLLSQPFAHGNLKPDNILVKEDGSLVLVDYDGIFVTSLSGQPPREPASPDFSHPSHTLTTYNEHLDDFPIATIALSLKAISLQPSLYTQFATPDRLLFSAADYQDIGRSTTLKAILSLSTDTELASLLSAFLLATAKNELTLLSHKLFLLQEPEKVQVEVLRTSVTDEDRRNAVKDEDGVLYSQDGFRLIEAPWWSLKPKFYKIKEGTKVICDSAFRDCKTLKSVTIPGTVTSIGNNPFCGCDTLQVICGTPHFTLVDNLLVSSSGKLIACLSSKEHILVPNTVTSIENSAFYRCKSLQSVNIPNSVTAIGECAFHSCSSLQLIHMPDSVRTISDRAFAYCKSLQSISIPNSVTAIGEGTFSNCISLQSVNIHKAVTYIGNSAFSWCKSLESINIPKGVTQIGKSTFYNCKSLKTINIPDSVTTIGEAAFFGCKSLKGISLPKGVTTIGEGAFTGCDALQLSG